ncbi:uncharacterized protein LAESUDRAFT_715133 [Laetiporus sulphureus 93-53]|uniref:Uncharacterized protein n=1 Tax=Laetiporus sulphureus 93-53 TaxID=1314785 RepID=A0A165DKM2_9APHY|nr:uncharacterized protein LAESUDRAFT_715133 [Laetiporus sulphureus 93-53]KZT05090.1 hypothetical protein LAESUDRAFT_715133 [Laetiporus sulphureus 93-53]
MTTNPGGPIIPVALTDWVEQGIKNIYTATTENALNAALDAFLKRDARLTVNGKAVTPQQYAALLRSEKAGELSASVKFDSVVAVPVTSDESVPQTGSVGAFYEATITTHLIKISHVQSSLNVVVVEDEKLKGQYDPRRVSLLNQVVLDTVPIVQPGATKA